MESLFEIDTKGSKKKQRKEPKNRNGRASSIFNITDGLDFGIFSDIKNSEKQTFKNSTASDFYLDSNILINGASIELGESRGARSVDEIMKRSVITPGLEKCDAIPMAETGRKKLAKLRKAEREKTKGSMWFNMPAPEMTDEMKHDLEVLQMRSVLDPKHFYKKNDLKVLPKYFQVGRVVEAPADFYHSRVPKKMRKKTIVEELLADAEFQKYNKKRYKEIIEQRRKTHFKAHKQAKKLKKKKRRH